MKIFRFQHLCLLCHETIQKDYAICRYCEEILPPAQEISDPYFNKIVIAFDYIFPVNKLITRLKFSHDLAYAKLLGSLLGKILINAYKNHPLPETIIPVPLHVRRLQERGFNQALEIAKPIRKKLGIPINNKIIYRMLPTRAQSSLSQKERIENMKNAFAIKKNFTNLPFRHIALLDDVITTGETLNELSKVLKQKGIEKIDIWCCARTPNP